MRAPLDRLHAIVQRTPLQRRSALAILADEESGDVCLMPRGEMVARLRAGDLGDLAHEAEVRRVPIGGLLVLFVGREGPRFLVVGGERRLHGVPRGRTRPR